MFQKISGETLGDQMARQLAQAIDSGQWLEGEYLPPEFELCRQFGVSRTTVRTALMILAQKGYIQTQRGRGSKITACRVTDSREQLQEAHRARCFLEAGAAAYVAGHGGEEALALLEKQYQGCAAPQGSAGYRRLLELGGVLVSLYKSDVLNQMHQGLAEVCLQEPPEQALLEKMAAARGRMLEAIKAGEAEAAYEAALSAMG